MAMVSNAAALAAIIAEIPADEQEDALAMALAFVSGVKSQLLRNEAQVTREICERLEE